MPRDTQEHTRQLLDDNLVVVDKVLLVVMLEAVELKVVEYEGDFSSGSKEDWSLS